jgi:hypothetical protein
VCAILHVAVPPPELGDQLFAFKERYMKKAIAPDFGDAMAEDCRDHVYEAFIIDMHGGRLRSISSGEVPFDKYAEELANRGIRSESTGSGFRQGCDQRKRREEDLRVALSVHHSGVPRAMIVARECPNLIWEMERFRKKTSRVGQKDIPTDEGDRRANTHAVECLEMGVSSGLIYVKPRKKAKQEEWIDTVLRSEKKREAERRATALVFGSSQGTSLSPIGSQ